VGNIARSILPVEQTHFMLRKVLPRYARLDLVLVMVGAADAVTWVERGMPALIASGEVVPDKIFERHPETRFGWRPGRTALWHLLAHLNRRLRRPVVVEASAAGWLRRVRRMRAEAERRIDVMPDPTPMLNHFERHLRALLETARATGARVVLVRQPWFGKDPSPEEEATFWSYGLGRPYKQAVTTYLTPRVVDALMREVDSRAVTVAASMDLEHVAVMEELAPRGRCFYDELHFTPEGAAVVGRTVARALLASSSNRPASRAPGRAPLSATPPAG
jgi:hypothetical protein